MWLRDIERAIAYLRGTNNTYNEYVFRIILPAQDGIILRTTHDTIVYVHNNGKIEEIADD